MSPDINRGIPAPSPDDWKRARWRYNRGTGLTQLLANGVGGLVCTAYFLLFDNMTSTDYPDGIIPVLAVMFVVLMGSGFIFSQIWGHDLTRFWRMKEDAQDPPPGLEQKAWRKILNAPIAATVIALSEWGAAGVIMGVYVGFFLPLDEMGPNAAILGVKVFFGTALSGIVTCTIVLFAVEAVCRKVWPVFFPAGGITRIRQAFRLKLRHRLIIGFTLGGLLPLILMAVLSYNKASLMLVMDPADVIRSLFVLTVFLLACALVVTLTISHLIANSVVGPVENLESAMTRVGAGDLDASVTVRSNDEHGFLADHFNRMVAGLRERARLSRDMNVAREVQQSLLPKENPVIDGLDVAGASVYCDETGGDYYDFLDMSRNGSNGLGFVVGDVSDHGIQSALFMTTARASLRQRLAMPGNLAEVVEDVNQQLCQAVGESGQFMTLSLWSINPVDGISQWVSAGHDPAIVYDPDTGGYSEMTGHGPALGLTVEYKYQEETLRLAPGQILLLATDGVWEARNRDRAPFGKDRLRALLRDKAALPAKAIVDAVMEAVMAHAEDKPQDDVTLVVVKVSH